MQKLFRSLLAIGVVAGLAACGDDVTVTQPPPPDMAISGAPVTAIAVGATVQLSANQAADWSSSNQSVASVGSSGLVTAVAPGTASITATSQADAAKSASVTITVVPQSNALTALDVTPANLSLVAGSTSGISTIASLASGATATFANSSNNSSVCTVTATGTNPTITAVAPGNCVVTVTATGSGTGLAGNSISKSVSVTVTAQTSALISLTANPINVNLGPGATQQVTTISQAVQGATVTYANVSSNTAVATVSSTGANPTITAVGNGTAVITITATGSATSYATNSIAATVTVSVQAALVTIQSITFGTLGTPVNVNNVFGQIDASINVTPNYDVVSQIDLLVDDQVVASQTLSPDVVSAADVQSAIASAADVIVLSFRTDSFNSTTGAAKFLNGNHVVRAVARVGSTQAQGQRASNTVALQFNNSDGFYVTMDNTPKNGGIKSIVSTGPAPGGGQEWRQGDVMVTSVPVVYTPTTPNGATAQTVCTRTISWTPGPGSVNVPGAGAAVTVGAPAACVGGSQVTTLVFSQGTAGYQSDPAQVVNGVLLRELPKVTGVTFADGSNMLYNANAAFTNTVGGVLNAPPNAYPPAPAPPPLALGSGVVNQGFLMDNLSPAGAALALPAAPNNWINNNTVTAPNVAYSWCGACSNAGGNATTRGADGTGVGIAAASTDVYEYEDRAVAGALWVGFQPNPNNIPENPVDFTNNAYNARLTEVDMLHNAVTVYLGGGASPGAQTAGVDAHAPTIEFTDAGTLTAPAISPFVIDVSKDSILNDLVNNTQGLNSTNAMFGVRIRDTRSGFDVLNNNYYFRKITRVAPSGTACAEGSGGACAFVNPVGGIPVGTDDPTYRRDSVLVYGTTGALTATSPGYYKYFTYAVDRAGNVSPTLTRRASIDVAAPAITGINFPATLPGASNVAFVPNGSDDLEVISGALYLGYPNMAGGPLRYAMFPPVHAPWLATTAAELATPVGNGAAFGSVGWTVPHGFLNGIDVVSPADSTPPVAVSATYAPTGVMAQFYDIKREEATLAGATPDSSFTFLAPILPAQLTAGTPFPAIGVGQWYIKGCASTAGVTAIQSESRTSTSITNQPFPQVAYFRLLGGSWQFLGTTVGVQGSNPTIFDQGSNRFWTYTSPVFAPALASGEMIAAVGMSAAGDGLASTCSVP